MDLIRSRLPEGRRRVRQGVGVVSRRRVIHGISVEEGSGNVYADLGFANAEAMLIKARLVAKIGEIVKHRGLTQRQAAAVLGMSQPKISALLRCRFRGVSQQRLLDCLTLLGRDVQIVVKPARRNRHTGTLTVLPS